MSELDTEFTLLPHINLLLESSENLLATGIGNKSTRICRQPFPFIFALDAFQFITICVMH